MEKNQIAAALFIELCDSGRLKKMTQNLLGYMTGNDEKGFDTVQTELIEYFKSTAMVAFFAQSSFEEAEIFKENNFKVSSSDDTPGQDQKDRT